MTPTSQGFTSHLSSIAQQTELIASLKDMQRGIEKESLRIQGNGCLALTPHPQALGSTLTHPEITTDYSEALLEFITPTYHSTKQVLKHLDTIQRYTYSQLGEELLWTSSMPCILGQDEDIPIAQYGSSNIGQMKTIYRKGLGHRYGRLMQTIAGIHYNVSFPDQFWQQYQNLLAQQSETQAVVELSLKDFKTQQYFGMIRNFRRYAWLLIYLFGASPAVCSCFVKGREHSLETLNKETLYAPYATALRMGDLGYQSSAQESLFVSYNSLDEYAKSLLSALTTAHPEYQKTGVNTGRSENKNGPEGYEQLSDSLLQIENEFYSTIRPKRTTKSGEAPIQALNDRGVEYIEVRCLDVNPYLPLGTDTEQLDFVDAFLLFCLLDNSPELDEAEDQICTQNTATVVMQGRKQGLELNKNGHAITLTQWGEELLDGIRATAELLDQAHSQNNHIASVNQQHEKLKNSALTPSAAIVKDIKAKDSTYFNFAMNQAKTHRSDYLDRPLDPSEQEHYQQLAADSLEKQRALEAEDSPSFSDFLTDYFKQYRS